MTINRFLRRFIWAVTLIGSLFLAACQRNDDAPQPESPSYSFSRAFTPPVSSTNPLLTVVYQPDSLNYTVSRTGKGLIIKIWFKGSRSNEDAVTVRLDSSALKPGLVGVYTVPLMDTLTTSPAPSSLLTDYTYFRSDSPGSASGFIKLVRRYLPGSYFHITGYDSVEKRITGQFYLAFPTSDPLAPNSLTVNRDFDWTIKLTSTFVRLPLAEK